MKMNMKARLIALEDVTSKKGNNYTLGLFQQGVDVVKLVIPVQVAQNVVENETYNCDIDYSTRWKNLSLVGVTVIG